MKEYIKEKLDDRRWDRNAYTVESCNHIIASLSAHKEEDPNIWWESFLSLWIEHRIKGKEL